MALEGFYLTLRKRPKGRIFSGAYFDAAGVFPKRMRRASRVTQGQEQDTHGGEVGVGWHGWASWRPEPPCWSLDVLFFYQAILPFLLASKSLKTCL